MHMSNRILGAAVGLALLTTACSPADSGDTATTAPPTTTTAQTTTTTLPPTTTTTPIETVRIVGDVASELAFAIGTFLSVVQDPRNVASGVDTALIAHHNGLSGALDGEYAGTTEMQSLETGATAGSSR